MAWIRLDDQFSDHPKFLELREELADAAMALWVRALGYCNKHETDGAIPRGALRQLSYHGTPSAVADELVRVGLWTATERGWSFHDYLDYQKSAAELQEQRVATSELRRKAGLKSGEVRRRKRDIEQEPNSRRTRTEQPTNKNRTADEQEPNSRRTPSPIPSPEISTCNLGGDPETSEPTRAPAREAHPPELGAAAMAAVPIQSGHPTTQEPAGQPGGPAEDREPVSPCRNHVTAPPEPAAASVAQARRALTGDALKIYDALRWRPSHWDTMSPPPLAQVATVESARGLAAKAGPGGRLEIEDVLCAISQCADKEAARRDAHELPMPRDRLANMLAGFVDRMQRGEARRRAQAATTPARVSPRGRVTEFQGGKLDRAEIEAQQRRQRERQVQEDTGII